MMMVVIYLLVTLNYFSYLAVDALFGIGELFGLFLWFAIFVFWILMLHFIEKKYFDGLYEYDDSED